MNTVTVALAVIINKENQILMTQRFDPTRPSMHLKWQLPGGGVKKSETISHACIREAKEETGMDVKLLTKKPIIIHSLFENTDFVLCGFLAEAISGTINTQKDIETADAKWIDSRDISGLDTLKDTNKMIERCMG